MKTFEQRFEKDIKKVVPWHKDEKGRRKFWTLCWLTYAGIFILLLIASALFTGAGLFFDDQASGPPWAVNWDSAKSVAPFVTGIIIFLIAIGLGIFFAIYFPGLFKESQEIFLASPQYRVKKLALLRMDLTRLSEKQLKWLCRLKYIDKAHYKSAIEAKKKKEKEATK